MDRLNPKVNNHAVVRVDGVNWNTWPRAEKRKYRKGDTLTTCTKCRKRYIGTAGWSQTVCKGLKRTAPSSTRRSWRKLGTDNRLALCAAWQISTTAAQEWIELKTMDTSKQKSEWTQDLTEEGIEPNPGPAGFQVINCNVQSAKGAWSMVEYPWAQKGVVITMQETRMTDNEFAAFTRQAHKKGFWVHHVAGNPMVDRWGAPRPNGGVIILVDKRLNSHGWVGKVGRASQVLGTWINDLFVGTFYAPPVNEYSGFDPATEVCELFNEIHLQSGCLSEGRWLISGDANSTPGDSPVAGLLSAYGGQVFTQGAPTRWEGHSEIDWFIGNDVQGVLQFPRLLDLHVSDHIPIQIEVKSHNLVPTGSLWSGPCWSRPEQISRDEWRELTERCWVQLNISLDEVFPSEIDVEDDWLKFNELLDTLFRHVFETMQIGSNKSEVVEEARRRLKQKGLKGIDVRHSMRVKPRSRHFTGPGSMRMIKLRKRVARIYELRRQLFQARQGYTDITRAPNYDVCEALMKRLHLDQLHCTPDYLEQELVLAKDTLAREERAFRKERLQGWKQKFVGSVKFASRWVQARKTLAAVQVADDDGVAGNEVEALEKIRGFWQSFWSRAQANLPPTDDIIHLLQQHTSVAPLTERPPSPVELRATATDMRGSAGMDGWSGDDLSGLPPQVWDLFAVIVDR